jgi:nucleoid-associated protein YgaU
MKKKLALALTVGVALMLNGCSLLKKNRGEVPPPDDATAPAAEAGTDAVPATAPEQQADAQAAPAPAEAAAPAEQKTAEAAPPAASTEAPTQPSGPAEDYTVQAGDTLMKIAFETYGDLYQWKKILELNRDKIKDPAALSAGTVLKVEKPGSPVSIDRNGEKYLIKLGDTLGKISNNVYGTPKKWRQIWDNNKQMIKDPNKIFAGFFLYYVPEGNQPQLAPAPLANSGQEAAPAQAAPAASAGLGPMDQTASAPPPPAEANRGPAAGGK